MSRSSVPAPSSETARRRMERQRSRDTKPELALRRELHRIGLRYRVDAPLPVPGVRRRADLLFPCKRVAVMVDSCFWHLCPEHRTWPSQNGDWWQQKLTRNWERDRDTDRRLQEAGWTVVRVWEHEPVEEAVGRVAATVAGARRAGSRHTASTKEP
jgi:DNA mismatch endonuclease (patch repair protein)